MKFWHKSYAVIGLFWFFLSTHNASIELQLIKLRGRVMNIRSFLKPYKFDNGLQLKNRIVMAPMTTMSSFYNGQITRDEIDYYQLRAGGPGMLITAVAYVSEQGKGFEGQLSIASDNNLAGLTELATTIKKEGTKAVIQIFHAGRMTNSKILKGIHPVSASAIAAVRDHAETPQALTEEAIETIIQDFAKATHRAIKAGFNGIELHGANTYLLQQFFSPHSNRRTDKWGGTLEKRMNFALAVINAVKAVIKKEADATFILGYRISPEEFETPGIRLQDTLAFVDVLKDTGIDYLHLSIGHIERKPLVAHSDQRPIIEQVLAVLKGQIPLIGVGSIKTPAEAEQAINSGLPIVAMGREFIREPKWVQKVESNDEKSIRYVISESELSELKIPPVMQVYLNESFREVMDFTSDDIKDNKRYLGQVAPMEGYEKKL